MVRNPNTAAKHKKKKPITSFHRECIGFTIAGIMC
jgi:hypothetical protein